MATVCAGVPGTMTPDLCHMLSCAKETAKYREMIATLAQASADIIIPAMIMEPRSAKFAPLEAGLPIWLGVCCSLLGKVSLLVGIEPLNRQRDP